ncbi:MAG TPA: hypothetical protein V6D17_21880 [Candidatus Obscuribacterales bacterium]
MARDNDLQVPHPDLVATGWFRQFWGPSGAFPVQLVGVLTSGEYVYFRARGSEIKLNIATSEEDVFSACCPTTFRKDCEVNEDNPFGASMLDPACAVELIKNWLTEYFRAKALLSESA